MLVDRREWERRVLVTLWLDSWWFLPPDDVYSTAPRSARLCYLDYADDLAAPTAKYSISPTAAMMRC